MSQELLVSQQSDASVEERLAELIGDERLSEVEEAVVQLLNMTVVSNGTTVCCELCGCGDDEHAERCPVPALEDWLRSIYVTNQSMPYGSRPSCRECSASSVWVSLLKVTRRKRGVLIYLWLCRSCHHEWTE